LEELVIDLKVIGRRAKLQAVFDCETRKFVFLKFGEILGYLEIYYFHKKDSSLCI